MSRVNRHTALAALSLVPATLLASPIDLPEIQQMPNDMLLAYENFVDLPYGEPIRIADLDMPGTQDLNLKLERVNVRAPGARVFEVDAAGNEVGLGDTGVRLFRGSVEGDPESMVFLASSPFFTYGFIQDAKKTYTISSGDPVLEAGLPASPIIIHDVNELNFGPAAAAPCGTDPAFPNFADLAADMVLESDFDGSERANQDVCRVVNIALDTDYEYTDRLFNGNTNAAAAYAESLLAAVSTIYESDVQTTFVTGFVRVFGSNNDPYENSGDALNQVVSHWRATKQNVDRNLTHYLSGRTNLSYGGVAYLSAVCDQGQGYGVSAYLNGSFPNPMQDNIGGNWDLVVMAHELGHNHGSGHTHDSYVPVIDGCGNGDCSLSANGTIMSYCHTCSGGISNIRLGFHPRVRAVINFFLGNLSLCDITNPAWTPDALAIDDSVSTLAGVITAIDVVANDSRGSCSGYKPSFTEFDSVSANGGTITRKRLPGRAIDGLFYKSPADFAGEDTFTYTNPWGEPATVTVMVDGFRAPEIMPETVAGALVEYFQFDEDLSEIPNFEAMTPIASEIVPSIDFALSTGEFGGSGLTDRVAARITGFFNAPLRGTYNFIMNSDDGSRLVIGNDLVVIDHDGTHAFNEATGQISLDEGPHSFTLEYFDNTGDAGLRLEYTLFDSLATLPETELRTPPLPFNCDVDTNEDGVLDNGDIGAFIGLFLAGDLTADFTGDGILDNGDIGAFVSSFLAGC